jgi:hypothetical protein
MIDRASVAALHRVDKGFRDVVTSLTSFLTALQTMPQQSPRTSIMAENVTLPVISVVVVLLPVLLLPVTGSQCGSRERS